MALKQYNPVTPSMRHLVLVSRDELHKGAPVKHLTEGLKKTGGRDNWGHITSRHRGGGHKRRYRVVDFKRTKHDMPATVERLEYDPNRTAHIALIKYQDGTLSYILAPQKLKAGDKVVSGLKVDIKPGNSMPLKNMPIGTIVHNIEIRPSSGGVFARSAGCYAQLVGKDGGYVQLKMNSGELRMVRGDCVASVGAVSNQELMNSTLGKAGRSRWLGVRPQTRGMAMNPVDHPHGGGEGRSKGGKLPVTPWGKGTKGNKTRTNKRTDKLIMRRRPSNKKK